MKYWIRYVNSKGVSSIHLSNVLKEFKPSKKHLFSNKLKEESWLIKSKASNKFTLGHTLKGETTFSCTISGRDASHLIEKLGLVSRQSKALPNFKEYRDRASWTLLDKIMAKGGVK